MSVKDWYHRVVDPLLERLSVREQRDGLTIADLSAEGGDRSGLKAIHASLDVLAAADPRRYWQVTQRLRAITVAKLGYYLGLYRRGSRTCLIDRETLWSRSAAEVAGTIVHEATHGRLRDLGFGYEFSCRQRIERLCRLEQLRFLRHAQVDPHVVDAHEATLDYPALTDDEVLEHDVTLMHANGLPRRLARILIVPRRIGGLLRARVSRAPSDPVVVNEEEH